MYIHTTYCGFPISLAINIPYVLSSHVYSTHKIRRQKSNRFSQFLYEKMAKRRSFVAKALSFFTAVLVGIGVLLIVIKLLIEGTAFLCLCIKCPCKVVIIYRDKEKRSARTDTLSIKAKPVWK